MDDNKETPIEEKELSNKENDLMELQPADYSLKLHLVLAIELFLGLFIIAYGIFRMTLTIPLIWPLDALCGLPLSSLLIITGIVILVKVIYNTINLLREGHYILPLKPKLFFIFITLILCLIIILYGISLSSLWINTDLKIYAKFLSDSIIILSVGLSAAAWALSIGFLNKE